MSEGLTSKRTSKMTAVPLKTVGAFSPDARGPSMLHWLIDSDVHLPDSSFGWGPDTRSIVGAQVQDGWVIFDGLQVIQIVPDEVHSRWYRRLIPGITLAVIWRIEDSAWLRSFHPQHLDGQRHFVLRFYDQTVEVICRDLLIGTGTFHLEQAIGEFPQLADAYWRRAHSRDTQGRLDEAAADYTLLTEIIPDSEYADYARRWLTHHQNQ